MSDYFKSLAHSAEYFSEAQTTSQPVHSTIKKVESALKPSQVMERVIKSYGSSKTAVIKRSYSIR